MIVGIWKYGAEPVARASSAIAAVLCGGLAVLLLCEVLWRILGQGSIRGLFEISELVLVMIAFLGMSQAEVNRTHVRVSLLTSRLGHATRQRVQGVGLVICSVFVLWMGWELAGRAYDAYVLGEFRSGLLNFPVWPSRSVVALGTLLLGLVMVVKSLVLLGARSDAADVAVEEDTYVD